MSGNKQRLSNDVSEMAVSFVFKRCFSIILVCSCNLIIYTAFWSHQDPKFSCLGVSLVMVVCMSKHSQSGLFGVQHMG